MTTAIAIPEPVEATLVAVSPDPFATLTRYLKAMADAREFADVVCMTPMVPKFYQGNPKAATVAILHGAELGFHPLQSLQQIFVVHGMPAIYARAMVALLKNRGFRFDTIETGPDRVVFQGWSPNGKESEISTWTIERAHQAGYIPKIDPGTGVYAVNKNGNLIGNEKYITEPENMLWAKAAAEVCRRLAPDVLLGIPRTVEDIESEPEPVRVQSERVSAAEMVLASAPAPVDPAVVIETWKTATEAPSNPGAKPDTVQVTDSAKASTESDPPMTKIQQRKLGRLYGERGICDDAEILSRIAKFLGRPVAAPGDVTRDEAIRLLARLEENLVMPEELETIREIMAELKVTDEAQQRDFASMILQKPVQDLSDLTTTEADTLITALADTLAGEQAQAAAEGSAPQ
ncbi:hypothetical protein [Nocardia sp. NPDC059228]|uniref:hypothetical protein n=1 Tax=Nocardia sp. NPDC059228 TaxID=3346777 RepID=UPI0036B57CD0